MSILILDNYDSFTYNLVHIVKELGYPVEVFRNDKIDLKDVGKYEKIILSPGPGIPDEAGIMKSLVHEYGSSKQILGVCLGHQGIAEVYGAKLFNLPKVLHGVTSLISVNAKDDPFYAGVTPVFQACHYHSWAVLPESIPASLEVTAMNDQGLIMGLKHKSFRVRGVQYHPESVMTPEGKKMMKNWLEE